MASEVCVWQPDEIDLLINLVRDRPELYDQSSAGYSNINTTEKLWSEIKIFFPTKNEKQLKKKWQILRSGYRSRRSEKKPSGSCSQVTKKWVYFDTLNFLEQHFTERATSSNVRTSTDNKSNATISGTQANTNLVEGEYAVDEFGYLSQEDNSKVEDSQNEEGRVPSPETPVSQRKAVHLIKKKRTSSNSVDDAFIDYFNNKKKEKKNLLMSFFCKVFWRTWSCYHQIN